MDIQQRYVLIGTSHVSKESKTKIKQTFADFKPDIIAVELDKNRYFSLINKQKTSLNPKAILQIGFLGYIFSIVGKIMQEKVGKMTGMNPGEEMLLGANLAKNNKLLLSLIDQDITKTLKNMSKTVTLKERLKLLKDLIFKKDQKIKIDINKIPEEQIITQILQQMKKDYPGLYKSLVEDRNKYMSKQIFLLLKNHPDKKIMAIVGAGHIEGMKKDLKSLIDSNILETNINNTDKY